MTGILKNVGIVGMPPLEIIRELNAQKAVIHDLDTPMIRADIELTAIAGQDIKAETDYHHNPGPGNQP